MDWQSIIIVLVVIAAVGYLGWSYFRSGPKKGACANCPVQQKLSLKKPSSGPSSHRH